MTKRLMILDCNSIVNRAYFALPPLTANDGTPTGAVYGFVNMLVKLIADLRPTHIAAAFDVKAPTFRKEIYAEYKATRKPMPDDLAVQIPVLKNLLSKMNICILELAGFEADDIIGTVSKQYDWQTFIITGDKDSLQLVDDSTTVCLTKSGVSEVVYCVPDNMQELFGLSAAQIVDYKALSGDKSDNIPGVPGVGDKTATALLQEYGTLENLYDNTHLLKGKLKEKIENNRAEAFLSKRLATIDVHVPIEVTEEDMRIAEPYNREAIEEMHRLRFSSIVGRLSTEETRVQREVIETLDVLEDEQLDAVLQEISKTKKMAFLTGEFFMLAADATKNYRVRIKTNFLEEGVDYDVLLARLKPVLEDASIGKTAYDYKAEKHFFAGEGIALTGLCDDVALALYVYDTTRGYKNADAALLAYDLDASSGAAGLFRMMCILEKKLDEDALTEIYRGMELPLIEVLYQMERTGFRVKRSTMEELKEKFGGRIARISEQIYEQAGETFNINSTKQLSYILFEKLGLQKTKKTKTGYSTDVDALNYLIDEHPIVPLLLEYRDTAKLLNTYIDGLFPMLDRFDRIHTVFKQTISATGRLSSTEPNLQNIPIKKPEGRELRRLFIASEGNQLVCADYSQIELRLLADFADDPVLKRAFNEGDDIHAITAAAAFGVPLGLVTPQMRSQAKAVNFGIIYGISDFGLASDIGITTKQARQFIERYFETYPNVKGYMNRNVEFAREHLYIRSLMGRIRRIPDIKASNYNVRSYAERIAMNMPLQGSASDIIKIAMIRTQEALAKEGLQAKMILQVHDELIVDAPCAEVPRVKEILKECMENAVSLSVRLEVGVGAGDNWLEAK